MTQSLARRLLESKYEGNPTKMPVKNPVHGSEAFALLDQLEELGIDVSEHCRKQRIRQYDALPSIEY